MANESLIGEEVITSPDDSPRGTVEHINLVAVLRTEKADDGDGYLVKYGKRSVREFKEDWDSNKAHWDRMARDLGLFLGLSEEYDYGPAKGKLRPCLPLLNKVVTRIYNRVATVVTKLEPVAVPTGPEDGDRVLRITKHMAWERRAKHPEWKSNMCASLIQWVLFGSMFRYVGWDSSKRKKVIEYLPHTDVVVHADEKDCSPLMENVDHYTIQRRWTREHIEMLGREGFLEGVDELFSDDAEKKPTPIKAGRYKDDPVRSTSDEYDGMDRSRSSTDSKDGNPRYLFLERHAWARLPESVNPEKKMRRAASWTEESTGKVMRLTIFEAENPLDRRRYQSQLEAMQMEQQNIAAEAQQVAAANAQSAAAGMPLLPEPPMPEPRQLAPIITEPVFPCIHYKFMEQPEGYYGMGAGSFASNMNELGNDAMGWWLIQTQLAAVGATSGWTTGEFATSKGNVDIDFGRFKPLKEMTAETLQKSILNFPFKGPDGSIKELIETFDAQTQVQMNAHDTLSGVPGPSHETAAGAKLRNARAAENVTMAMESIFIPLAAEFKAYARLNATYMDDDEYFYVNQPDPAQPDRVKPERVTIGRRDYEEDFDVTFDSDARLMFDEGLGEQALVAYQLVSQSQFADPNTKLEAEKRALKALGQDDLVRRYPASIPPPEPPSPKSQEEENAGFLAEQDHEVLPDDDDAFHLAKMEEFETTGVVQGLTPTGKQMFERHRQKHRAQAYLKGAMLAKQSAEEGNNGQPSAYQAAAIRTGAPTAGMGGS